MPLPFPVIAIAAALAAAGAGALVIAARLGDGGQSAPEAAGAPAAAPETAGAAEAAAVETAAVAPEAEVAAPRLDVVRVAPDGGAVVAGRAEPGATVTLRTEDGVVAEATADADGEFVAVFEVPPATEPRTLTLEAAAGTGTVVSPDVVLMLPAPEAAPASTRPTQVGAADAAGAQPAGAAEAPAAGDGAAVADAGAAEGAPAPEAAAQLGQAQDAGGAAMAAADGAASAGAAADGAASGDAGARIAATAVVRGGVVEAAPLAPGTQGLTLASISYGDGGAVTLAGLGAAGTRLLAYVDDAFARDGTIGPDGRWSLEIADLPEGVHRLRIDAVRPDGDVLARVETPFQRDLPPQAEGGAGRPAAVVVQPGNNLWTLARIHYGAGVLYSRIYTANRDLIRDPALIYPGQILALPEGEPAE